MSMYLKYLISYVNLKHFYHVFRVFYWFCTAIQHQEPFNDKVAMKMRS